MTKADWEERLNPSKKYQAETWRVLWKQWRLELHENTHKAWMFVEEDLEGYGFILPRERPTPSAETATIAMAAVANQFFARYTLPQVPGSLDLFVDDPDEDGEGLDATRPDPEPDDWYGYIANAMGITTHEDWPEIAATIEWFAQTGSELGQAAIADYDPDHVVRAKILCWLSFCSRSEFKWEPPDEKPR